MAHGNELSGRVYRGGFSRGDTPPLQFGAGGLRTWNTARETCPYEKDENALFSPRSTCMSMDVLHKEDLPAVKTLYLKDYTRSLMTHDIPGATPVLAHPTVGGSQPLPWSTLEKPELPEIPKSKAETHYPAIFETRRPRDLSLRTSDIPGSQPRHRTGEPRARPGVWAYDFPAPDLRSSGRCTLDVSDIDGTQAKSHYPGPKDRVLGDTLKCESEFRARGREAAFATAMQRAEGGSSKQSAEAVLSSSCASPRFRRDAQDPRYTVPLTVTASNSVHCRFSEERASLGDLPPATQRGEIGPVDGSMPRTLTRDNGEPFLSLETQDVPGATTLQRVAGLPYSIFGPPGRRVQSTSLQTCDIEGAQADTVTRGPKQRARPAHADGGWAAPRRTGVCVDLPAERG